MLQHHTPGEQTSETLSIDMPRSSTEPSLDAHQSAYLEDFLDRVFARLVAVLPYEERQARREAMRGEILQNATAQVELGSTRQEALELAIAQIQREQAAANVEVRSVQRTVVRQPSTLASTSIALGFFGLFYLLDQTRAAGHLWSHWIAPIYGENGATADVARFYRFELLVLPLICGLAVGLLSRHRPVRGTLNALGLIAIPAILWGGVAYGLMYAGLLGAASSQWPAWTAYLFPNPVPAVAGGAFWIALGSLAAGAGGWLRRRGPRAKSAFRALSRRMRRPRNGRR